MQVFFFLTAFIFEHRAAHPVQPFRESSLILKISRQPFDLPVEKVTGKVQEGKRSVRHKAGRTQGRTRTFTGRH